MDVKSHRSLPSAVKQNLSPTIERQAIPPHNTSAFPTQKSTVPPRKPSAEVIAEVFPSEPPSHVLNQVFLRAVDSKPRTKGYIIGWWRWWTHCHRWSHWYSRYKTKCEMSSCYRWWIGKQIQSTFQRIHEHRNAVVLMVDELLRQDGIDRNEYAQYNNVLAESLESEESTKDETESTTIA